MLFQALDYKRNNFFNLLDNKYLSIKPIYTKDSAWLELFEHSNLLYARTTRAITNHAPIGDQIKYRNLSRNRYDIYKIGQYI